MKLLITDTASKWFQDNFNLQAGDGVRFFGKTTQPHHVKHGPNQGYAVENDVKQATVVETKNKINYHINFDDAWFFSGLITLVDYREGDPQPQFLFQREEEKKDGNFTAEDVDATTGASRNFEEFWE
ncbi:MAG: Fe-S cluster assembly protein HesB [Candidatus Limosilactobacillus merdavium]|uniref:Fe-S cluster assembly protein HesB n=1 Tax=Candidatus Limosilactobacillus merdavium TaxID=2838651 RepID=A0A9E2NUG1_9LACO|nr:Fe-S cluster assembly protein HesB [Candidatus Limosilactobacillus merdavium]